MFFIAARRGAEYPKSMSLRKIARLGNPVLSQMAEAVPEKDFGGAVLKALVQDMIETMRDADGVGLAAPQIHESKRVLIAEAGAGNPRYRGRGEVPLTVIINPEIVYKSPKLEVDWEGCLSIPDLRGLVPRAAAIKVRGRDAEGETIEIEAKGFYARVIQHEVDHLDGIVFLEQMKDLKSLCFTKEFMLYKQED